MIVVDNVVESEDSLNIVADANQDLSNIPMVMISKADGDNIKSYDESKKDVQSEVVLNIKFPQMIHKQNSLVQIWVLASDYRSMLIAQKLSAVYH